MAAMTTKLCRHCNGPVPFFRSLAASRFCSPIHEREYKEQIEALALDRLTQAAERIKLASTPEVATIQAGSLTVA